MLSQSTHDVAQWLLTTVETALDDCGRDPINLRYVAAGSIAWDDCCGMLVVAPEQTYRSITFPTPATEEELCFGGYLAIDFLVLLVRCIPTVDDRGRAPTQAQLQSAYTELLEDAAVVYNALTSPIPDYMVRSAVTQSFGGAEGGCISVETRLTIGIEQTQWAICCAEPQPHEPGDPICRLPASLIRFDPCEGLESDNVQDALCEIVGLLPTLPHYGVFRSDLDQTASVNTPNALALEVTEEADGISVVSGTQITVTRDGVYDFQFSAQLHHRGGGGTGDVVDIWFALNGNPLPSSATKVVVPNGRYVVAAWNYMLSLTAGDHIELIYYTNNAQIAVEHVDAASPIPAVPSLIVTVAQVRP